MCDIPRVRDRALKLMPPSMQVLALAVLAIAASAHLCTLNPLQRDASNINGFINTPFATQCFLYKGTCVHRLVLVL